MAARKRRDEKTEGEEPAAEPFPAPEQASGSVHVGGEPPRATAVGLTAEQYVGADRRPGKAGFLAYARAKLARRMSREDWQKAEAAHLSRPVR